MEYFLIYLSFVEAGNYDVSLVECWAHQVRNFIVPQARKVTRKINNNLQLIIRYFSRDNALGRLGLRSGNKFYIIIALCSVITFSTKRGEVERQLEPTIVPGRKIYSERLCCCRCWQTMKIFSIHLFEIMRARDKEENLKYKKCLKQLWVCVFKHI